MTEFADIASYQHGASPAAYARAGYDRIAMKATQGSSYTNPDFDAWWRAAGACGLARLAYHFTTPGTDTTPGGEAAHLLAAVQAAGGLGPRDRLVIDAEYPSQPTYMHGAWVAALVGQLVARGQTTGLIYSGSWWLRPAGLTAAMLPAGWRQLWLSDYSGTPDATVPLPPGWVREQLVARQYTDATATTGVPGQTDRSRVVRDWLTGDGMPLSTDDLNSIRGVVASELDRATGAGQADWEGTVRATLAAIQADFNADANQTGALARIEALLGSLPGGSGGPLTAGQILNALPGLIRQDLAAVVAAGVQLLAAPA